MRRADHRRRRASRSTGSTRRTRLAVAVDGGGAVQDQHRRAEGAAGAERLDEPQDRGRAQAGLQRRRSRSCRCSTRRASARPASAIIPEGQTETLLPMNAAGNAQVRKWKTAVLGTADGRQRPGLGVVAAGHHRGRAAVRGLRDGAGRRRAGQDDRHLLQGPELTRRSTGTAKVKLLGLPPKVTAPDLEITKDTKELAFKLTIDKTSPAGQHKQHLLPGRRHAERRAGGAQRRRHASCGSTCRCRRRPTPPPAADAGRRWPKPADPAKPPEKRLTRLEQLRLEQEEREKAAKGGTPPPPPKK